MAELLTGFNGKRIFAERASQDSAGDCIRTTYLKKADLVTTQSDWAETDTTSDAYIDNKPDIIIPLASANYAAPTNLTVVGTLPSTRDATTIYLVPETLT